MTIELFGMARHLAGATTLEIGGEHLTRRELVRALAELPEMAGNVVDPECETFVAPNMLLLDGRRVPGDDEPFYAADKPCVLFLASGG